MTDFVKFQIMVRNKERYHPWWDLQLFKFLIYDLENKFITKVL